MRRVLREVQHALESLYRVDAAVDVRDFLIGDEVREALGLQRMPREQLLLREEPDGLSVGLFVDELALRRLERMLTRTETAKAAPAAPERAREEADQRQLLMEHDHLGEFLLVVEGVSHFLYVALRTREHRPFSGLELELQAEIDKYLLALLWAWPEHGHPPEDLRERLFARVSFLQGMSSEEHDRYRTANAVADDYVASLETRFVRRRAMPELLAEVRRFYRLDCAGKLDHIVRQAA
ncbi:MAG TPA: hypothetical protein VH877_29785 [Polyangia bacterium]|jgi:hypothetical protein|nr:hypothetical protein [Polyangia bacterium]